MQRTVFVGLLRAINVGGTGKLVRSKLEVPFAKTATGCNRNTVRQLAALARELAAG